MARKLRLVHPQNLVLEGQGWNLTVTFQAQLERRRASAQFADVTVALSRPNIRCILKAIAAMHVRDRQRLATEAARIENEIKDIHG